MKRQNPFALETPPRCTLHSPTQKAYLQRQHLVVYRKEGNHGFGPGTQTGYIPAYALSGFNVVVCHFEVRIQKFYHFFIDCVFWELLWKRD